MDAINDERFTVLVREAMQTMAEIDIESRPGDEVSWSGDHAFGSTIPFTVGDVGYEVRLAAMQSFCNEFGSALLGLTHKEFEDSGEAALALQELANILAGEVLRVTGANNGAGRLGLPESISPADALAGTPFLQAWFECNGGALSVSLHGGA